MWSTVAALGSLITLLLIIAYGLKKYGGYRADKAEIKLVKKYKRLSNEEKAEFIKNIHNIYDGNFNAALGLHDEPKEDVWGGDARIRDGNKSPNETGETR